MYSPFLVAQEKVTKEGRLPAAPNAAQAGPSNAGEARAVATQPHWKRLAAAKRMNSSPRLMPTAGPAPTPRISIRPHIRTRT